MRPTSRSRKWHTVTLITLLSITASRAVALSQWTPPRRVSDAFLLPSLQVPTTVAIDASGNAVTAWSDNGILVSRRAPGGVWSTPVLVSRLSAGDDAFEPAVAIAPNGDAAVIWAVSRRVEGQPIEGMVQVARFRRSGGAASPRTIADHVGGDVWRPRIGVDAAGGAVAAWQCIGGGHASTVFASTLAKGAGWSTPVEISGSSDHAHLPDLAVGANGSATVVWQVVDTTGGTFVPFVVKAASWNRFAWSAPTAISPETPETWNPSVAVDAQGRSAAIWNQASSIVTALQPSDGTWGAPTVLSDASRPSYGAPDIAMDAAGNVLAVWNEFDSGASGNRMFAAVHRRGDQSWRAPVALTGGLQDVSDPRAALAQDHSIAAIAWIDNATNTVHAATRLPGGNWSSAALGAGLWDNPVSIAAGESSRACAVCAAPVTHYTGAIEACSLGD